MSAASDTLATDGKPTTTRAVDQRAFTAPDPELDALRAILALGPDAQIRVAEYVASRNGKRLGNRRGTDE